MNQHDSGNIDAAGVTQTDESAIRARVGRIILDLAPIKDVEPQPTSLLVADLGFDSLGLLELVGVLEAEFGLDQVPDDDALAVETVGEAQQLVTQILDGGLNAPDP